ncbi:unnamed protein product [Effrenium voratum]|nr:unnamed protein product [Effrenium voratum]
MGFGVVEQWLSRKTDWIWEASREAGILFHFDFSHPPLGRRRQLKVPLPWFDAELFGEVHLVTAPGAEPRGQGVLCFTAPVEGSELRLEAHHDGESLRTDLEAQAARDSDHL